MQCYNFQSWLLLPCYRCRPSESQQIPTNSKNEQTQSEYNNTNPRILMLSFWKHRKHSGTVSNSPMWNFGNLIFFWENPSEGLPNTSTSFTQHVNSKKNIKIIRKLRNNWKVNKIINSKAFSTAMQTRKITKKKNAFLLTVHKFKLIKTTWLYFPFKYCAVGLGKKVIIR